MTDLRLCLIQTDHKSVMYIESIVVFTHHCYICDILMDAPHVNGLEIISISCVFVPDVLTECSDSTHVSLHVCVSGPDKSHFKPWDLMSARITD